MSDDTTTRYEALRLCGVLHSYHKVFEDGSGVRVALAAAALALPTVYELCIIDTGYHKKRRDATVQRVASTVVVVEEKYGGDEDRDRVHRLSLRMNAPRALFPQALWAVTVSLVMHATAPAVGSTYYDIEKWYTTPGAEDASVECPCYVADIGVATSRRLGPYSRRQLSTTLATPKGLCAPALSGFMPAAVRGAFLRAKLPNATLGPVNKYFTFAADALAPTMRALQDCMSRGMVREALERSNVQVRRHNGRVIRMIKEMHGSVGGGGGGGGPAARNLLDTYRGVESTVDDFLSAEAQIFGSGVLGVFDLDSLAERSGDFWTIQVRTDDRLNPKELLAPTTLY